MPSSNGSSGGAEQPADILLCPQCSEFLGSGTASSLTCPTCGDTYCPYCQRSVVDRCPHLFAAGYSSDLDPWYRSPFEGLIMPHLRGGPPPGRSWSEAQVAEVFGDLIAAVDAYEEHDGLAAPPRQDILFDVLVEHLTVPIYADIRFEAGNEETTTEFAFFSEDPERARAELAALVARLAASFRRLEATPPADTADGLAD